MKRVLLVVAVAAAALAYGQDAEVTSSGSPTVGDVTASSIRDTGALVVDGPTTLDGGVTFAPGALGAGTAVYLSNASNDLNLNTPTSQSINFRVNGSSQWFVNSSQLGPSTNNAEDIGASGSIVRRVYTDQLRDGTDAVRLQISNSSQTVMRSPLAAGGGTTTAAFLFNTTNTLGSGDLLADVQNNGTTKFQVFGSGDVLSTASFVASSGVRITSNTLPTCDSSMEGSIRRQGGAASSAVRTKLCMCTSDGAGTPGYAWKNISIIAASEAATVGTSTTCP